MSKSNPVVSINYKKHGEDSALSQHGTVLEGVNFVRSLDPKNLEYVSLTDGYGFQVIGHGNIQDVYERHDDLWGGKKHCIHPFTQSPSGGGIHCTTCKAWFCY